MRLTLASPSRSFNSSSAASRSILINRSASVSAQPCWLSAFSNLPTMLPGGPRSQSDERELREMELRCAQLEALELDDRVDEADER